MERTLFVSPSSVRREGLKEGAKEAVKERIVEEDKHTRKFEALAGRAGKVLLRIKSIKPFFADEIIVDVAKVTVVFRNLFFSERVQSVPIKNLLDVFTDAGPLFSTLEIVDVGFKEELISIKWLKREEAEKARRIITGLMEAAKEDVDLTHLDAQSIIGKLEKIGEVKEP